MEPMYPSQNNSPHAELTESISSSATQITVNDGAILPEAPCILTLGVDEDAELVYMSAKNDNILVVTRGYYGTTARAWPIETWIRREITSQDIDALQANVQEVKNKLDTDVVTLSPMSLTPKQESDVQKSIGIINGYEYSGRALPFTWAELQTKIKAGDFSGIRVGDYKDITLNGSFYDAASAATKSYSNIVVRMEIAGIDSYFRYADNSVPHHVDFISRDCLPGALLYNATATNSGSFIGSALFTTLNGASGIVKLLPAEVQNIIVQKRGLTETKTAADASGWAWNDMGLLWLPTEREVWGNHVWSEPKYGGGLNVQYPIFKDGLRHIVKGDGNGGGRCTWWCASSMAGSTSDFCRVYASGYPADSSATNSNVRVPLCFRVA